MARRRNNEKPIKKKKRKRGRPKKKGPKRNRWKHWAYRHRVRKKRGRPTLPPRTFIIAPFRNGHQCGKCEKFRYREDALNRFDELKTLEEKREIVFPSEVTGKLYMEPSITEYLLIEKKDTEVPTLLTNEYGQLVEHSINIDGWVIIDKFRFEKEETFWVWGEPKRGNGRKDFRWIWENKVINGIVEKSDFKRVYMFFNKIIIKNDDNEMEVVFCKNVSDAIRFYNLLETWCKKEKIKQVLFFGDYSYPEERRANVEQELVDLTGWNLKKVRMRTNVYYNVPKEKKKKRSDNLEKI